MPFRLGDMSRYLSTHGFAFQGGGNKSAGLGLGDAETNARPQDYSRAARTADVAPDAQAPPSARTQPLPAHPLRPVHPAAPPAAQGKDPGLRAGRWRQERLQKNALRSQIRPAMGKPQAWRGLLAAEIGQCEGDTLRDAAALEDVFDRLEQGLGDAVRPDPAYAGMPMQSLVEAVLRACAGPRRLRDARRGLACLGRLDLVDSIRCGTDVLPAGHGFRAADVECAWRIAQELEKLHVGWEVLDRIAPRPALPDGTHPSVRAEQQRMLQAYLRASREKRSEQPGLPATAAAIAGSRPARPTLLDKALLQTRRHLQAAHAHAHDARRHGTAFRYRVPAVADERHAWAWATEPDYAPYALLNGLYTEGAHGDGSRSDWQACDERLARPERDARIATGHRDDGSSARRPGFSRLAPWRDKSPFHALDRMSDGSLLQQLLRLRGGRRADLTHSTSGAIQDARVMKTDLLGNLEAAILASGNAAALRNGTASMPAPRIGWKDRRDLLRLAVIDALRAVRPLPAMLHGIALSEGELQQVAARTAGWLGENSQGMRERLREEMRAQGMEATIHAGTLVGWSGDYQRDGAAPGEQESPPAAQAGAGGPRQAAHARGKLGKSPAQQRAALDQALAAAEARARHAGSAAGEAEKAYRQAAESRAAVAAHAAAQAQDGRAQAAREHERVRGRLEAMRAAPPAGTRWGVRVAGGKLAKDRAPRQAAREKELQAAAAALQRAGMAARDADETQLREAERRLRAARREASSARDALQEAERARAAAREKRDAWRETTHVRWGLRVAGDGKLAGLRPGPAQELKAAEKKCAQARAAVAAADAAALRAQQALDALAPLAASIHGRVHAPPRDLEEALQRGHGAFQAGERLRAAREEASAAQGAWNKAAREHEALQERLAALQRQESAGGRPRGQRAALEGELARAAARLARTARDKQQADEALLQARQDRDRHHPPVAAGEPDWTAFSAAANRLHNREQPLRRMPVLRDLERAYREGRLGDRTPLTVLGEKLEEVVADHELGSRLHMASGAVRGINTDRLYAAAELAQQAALPGVIGRLQAGLGYTRKDMRGIEIKTDAAANAITLADTVTREARAGAVAAAGAGVRGGDGAAAGTFGYAGAGVSLSTETSRGVRIAFERHDVIEGDAARNRKLGRIMRQLIDPAPARGTVDPPYLKAPQDSGGSPLADLLQEYGPDGISIGLVHASERRTRRSQSAGVFAGVGDLPEPGGSPRPAVSVLSAGLAREKIARARKVEDKAGRAATARAERGTRTGVQARIAAGGLQLAHGAPAQDAAAGQAGHALTDGVFRSYEFRKKGMLVNDLLLYADGRLSPRTRRVVNFTNFADFKAYLAPRLAAFAIEKAYAQKAAQLGADADPAVQQSAVESVYRRLLESMERWSREWGPSDSIQVFRQLTRESLEAARALIDARTNALERNDRLRADVYGEMLEELLAPDSAWEGAWVQKITAHEPEGTGPVNLGIVLGGADLVHQARYSDMV